MEVAAAGVDCMYPLAYEYSHNAKNYGKNGDMRFAGGFSLYSSLGAAAISSCYIVLIFHLTSYIFVYFCLPIY